MLRTWQDKNPNHKTRLHLGSIYTVVGYTKAGKPIFKVPGNLNLL